MKETRRIVHTYLVWDYDKEEEDINRRAREGWELVKGGMFSHVYRRSQKAEYRYALDFHMEKTDRSRYFQMYEEMGWEYVSSTMNGWHYFRKAYDPLLPEEEYQIYTDESSIRAFMRPIQIVMEILFVLALLLTVIQLVVGVMNGFGEFRRIMALVESSALCAATFTSVILIWKKRNDPKFRSKVNPLVYGLFIVVLVTAILR